MEGGGSSTSSASTSSSQIFVPHPQIELVISSQMEASSEISSSDNNTQQQQPSTSSGGPSSSSAAVAVAETLAAAVEASLLTAAAGGEDHEPCKKKARVNSGPGGGGSNLATTAVLKLRAEKLEHRLGGILCCAVCLDLPRSAIYQCTNGHLMCAGCFTHLLADARLRDEIATCPNCRVEISKHLASRNLAVEKAVNELPAECQFCNKEFSRNSVEHHEREGCEERTSICKYQRIGCPWRGPHHELTSHQENCIHPKKSGAEVMDILRLFDEDLEKEKKVYHNIFELLNYEKITFNDLQLKPYRTDEFVHKLFYETSRFSAFNNQFVVKARINNNQRDPTLSCDRIISYQLILKTKPTANLDVSFVVLKGPFGDGQFSPKINRFDFSEQNNESPYFHLPINETSEVNRLLSQKAVHFRLIAFLQ